MISYNQQEFETMQQEAIKRVHEMQKRAKLYINDEQNNSTSTPQKPQQQHQNAPQQALQNNPNRNRPQNNANVNSNSAHNSGNKPNEHSQKNHSEPPHSPPPQNKPSNSPNPPHRPQNNMGNMGNPFAQLFGSNMGGFNRYKNNNSNTPAKPPEHHQPPENPDENAEQLSKGNQNFLDDFFKNFNLDQEKLLIIVLIYLLYKNGADMKLILALGYLLI